MAFYMGIDIGSQNSKGVIMNDNKLLVHYLIPSGVNHKEISENLRENLLSEAHLSFQEINYTIATGCGADNVYYADEIATDLVCSARGINRLLPSIETVIEVAGRSSKVMRIDSETGKISDLAVTDRCATGSGYFIQVIANVLRIKLEDVGPLSLKSRKPITFSTGCVVFAETETITRVAEGISKEDIIAGVHNALADKIFSLASRIGIKEGCAIIGGGALDIGLVASLKERMGVEISVPPLPQIVTAIGAATLAEEKTRSIIQKSIRQTDGYR